MAAVKQERERDGDWRLGAARAKRLEDQTGAIWCATFEVYELLLLL